jgi:pimeloyl-ACP methyl ester carboxylesterase
MTENQSSKRLVFLHGLGGTAILWKNIARLFSPDEFAICAFDQRGHGHSKPPPGANFDPLTLSQDVIDTIESFKWDTKPLIIGHSMGARTALGCVYLKPEAFCGLILVDMPFERSAQEFEPLSGFLRQMPHTFANFDIARAWLKEHSPDLSIAQYVTAVLIKQSDETIKVPFQVDNLVQIIEEAKDSHPGDWMRTIGEKTPLPTLAFRGKKSQLWTDYIFARDKQSLEGIKNLEFIEVDDATHGLPFEKKELFVQKVEAFIKSQQLFS